MFSWCMDMLANVCRLKHWYDNSTVHACHFRIWHVAHWLSMIDRHFETSISNRTRLVADINSVHPVSLCLNLMGNFKHWEMVLQSLPITNHMSRVMRKATFCICENNDADQVRGNREADQRFCFRYIDSTSLYFLNPKFQASIAIFCSCSAWFVSDQVGNQNVGFLMTRLIYWNVFSSPEPNS